MAAAYSWADVIVCRAGALTGLKLPMLDCRRMFVLPHAVDDRQTPMQNPIWTMRRVFWMPQKN